MVGWRDGRTQLEERFPKLVSHGYYHTSQPTDAYNCVAWIARDVTQWWSPEDVDGYYWPFPKTDGSLRAYLAMFETFLGYRECPSGALRLGSEKIAVYVDGDEFCHVAHQRSDGTWSSKIGELGDICHTRLESICGSGVFEYSPHLIFMCRPRQPHRLAETGLLLP